MQGGGLCVFTHELESAIRRDRAIEAALTSCVPDKAGAHGDTLAISSTQGRLVIIMLGGALVPAPRHPTTTRYRSPA